MAGKFGIGDLAAMGLGNVGIGPLNVGNVLDTVEFVKKAWASFGVPSTFAPTVDLEELDKRIADLKAVEQWLTVNMNMLQGTIQALEIQRGTIATLRAFSDAVGAPVAAVAPAKQALASALAGAAAAGPGRTSAPAPPIGTPAGAARPVAAPTGKRARRPTTAAPTAGTTAVPAAGIGTAAFADPGLSPGAWWNLLQNQFNQVAAAALSGVGLPKPGAGIATMPQSARGAKRGAQSASGGAARTASSKRGRATPRKSSGRGGKD